MECQVKGYEGKRVGDVLEQLKREIGHPESEGRVAEMTVAVKGDAGDKVSEGEGTEMTVAAKGDVGEKVSGGMAAGSANYTDGRAIQRSPLMRKKMRERQGER